MRERLPVFLAAGVLFAAGLGARDLWHPNEPTYGQAVAEMSARGEWLVPTVNGLPFAEKPILYFWLARLAALATGGVSELSLRLPSMLAALVALVLLERLVRRYSDARHAAVAAVVLATTYIVFWSARMVQMDLLLTVCTLGSISALVGAIDGTVARWRGWIAGGLAAGLGFLAKGPAGVVCPLLVVLPYALATGKARELLRPAAGGAVLTFALVASPWPLALALRGDTAFLSELFWRQNVERFLEPWDHEAPWWYFAEALLLDGLPWSPLLVVVPWTGRRLERLAWIWLAAIVVFFSFSASKRSPYFMPALPALAILVSSLLVGWWRGEIGRIRQRAATAILGAMAVVLGVGGVLAIGALDEARVAAQPALRIAVRSGAVLMLAGSAAIVAGALVPWRRRIGAAIGLLVFTVISYATAALSVLPAFDAIKSHRPFCQAIVARVGPAEPLHGYRLWRWRAAYSFYSGREIRSLDSPQELSAYWQRPERVFLLVERGMLDEVRATVDPGPPLADRAVGSNHVYLFQGGASLGDGGLESKAD